ncbi:TPA: GNAT family N-acetyltransferase [Streptococcus agalactiae]
MQIRLAFPNEIDQIMLLIEEARAEIAKTGSDQWQKEDGYPNRNDIIDDILNGYAWVGIEDGMLATYAAVIDGHEEVYDAIYERKWLHDNHRYLTFHRIAISNQFRGRGLAQTFLQGLIEGHKGPDFRCDTHEKNVTMQHILNKLGYQYCGKVPLDGVRLAYQKIKEKGETSIYREIDERNPM